MKKSLVLSYAVALAAYIALVVTVGLYFGDSGPADPPSAPTLADVLGAPDDVFPGCLPIGSTEPSERTAVYASIPGTLVFVCTEAR